jgi:hypothetical protein
MSDTEESVETTPRTMTMARPGRKTAVFLAVLMPLGPLCVAALRGLLPTFASESGADVAAAVTAAPGRQSAVVWLGSTAMLLLVPGVLAVAGLTREAAPRLTWWALALVVPGYLALGAIVAGDAMLWSASAAGLDDGAVAALYDHPHPATIVGTAVFVVGHVVGTVLLGVALLRSRRVPAVFAWLLTISQPLHFAALVILGVQPLDVFAWCLTAVGMGAAAWALLNPGRSAPTRVRGTDLAAAGA